MEVHAAILGLRLERFPVQLGIVLQMQAHDGPLVERQVTGMQSDSVILITTALTDVMPSPLLLKQIQACKATDKSAINDTVHST